MKRIFLLISLFVSLASQAQPNLFHFGLKTRASVQVGDPDYFDPQSGDITFTDDHFWFSAPGYAKTGFTGRSPGGYVEFRTSETDFDVKIGGNWSTATTGNAAQSSIWVIVDGVYNQTITLTANNTTETHSITSLSAGEKIIRLINGYAAQSDPGNDINLPNASVSVQGVVTTGDIEIKIPTIPANLNLFIGNSITTGASGTRPTQTGWVALLRDDGWEVQYDSYGARGLATNAGTFGSTQADDMADYVVAQMNGTVSNTVFICLGTNDFFLSGWRFSKATWKTHVELFADALHAAMPSLRIIWVTPLNRTDYDTPNANGADLEDYTDAVLEVQADGRSAWLEVIVGKDLVSLANLADGLHPNQTGMAEIKTNFLTAYNAL